MAQEKPIDERCLDFIVAEGPRIMEAWRTAAESGGLHVSAKDGEEYAVTVRRADVPGKSVDFHFVKFLLDVAATDRDRPQYDGQLADPLYRARKESRLIGQFVTMLQSCLDSLRDGKAEPADITAALWQDLAAQGHHPQRIGFQRIRPTDTPQA